MYLQGVAMNHLTATYIDFVQTLGVILIFGVAAYAINQMLNKTEKQIIEVKVRVDNWTIQYLFMNR